MQGSGNDRIDGLGGYDTLIHEHLVFSAPYLVLGGVLLPYRFPGFLNVPVMMVSSSLRLRKGDQSTSPGFRQKESQGKFGGVAQHVKSGRHEISCEILHVIEIL